MPSLKSEQCITLAEEIYVDLRGVRVRQDPGSSSKRRLDTRECRLSSCRPGGRLKAQLPVASPTLVLPGTSQRLHDPHPLGLRKAKYISGVGYFYASSSDFSLAKTLLSSLFS